MTHHHRFNRIAGSAALAAGLLLAPSAYAAAPTDLAVTATAVGFRVGTQGTYTITVLSRGRQATDDAVHVTTILPPGLTYVSQANPGWACSASGQAVDCLALQPVGARARSTVLLTVAICDAAYPVVRTTFTVSYAGDVLPANNSTTRATVVRSGHCASPPTATPVPGTVVPTQTPTPVPTSSNPAAPVVSDFTCNGSNQCTLAIGQSFAMQFIYSDANNNAISWNMTARRDDGEVSNVGYGSFASPSGHDTVPLQFPAFTCPRKPCRQTGFVFSVTVTDTTGFTSAPATVAITVSAS